MPKKVNPDKFTWREGDVLIIEKPGKGKDTLLKPSNERRKVKMKTNRKQLMEKARQARGAKQ